jgi:hypothetical protein
MRELYGIDLEGYGITFDHWKGLRAMRQRGRSIKDIIGQVDPRLRPVLVLLSMGEVCTDRFDLNWKKVSECLEGKN